MERCIPDLVFNPELALIETKPFVELFVREPGIHEIWLTRTDLNFKRQQLLERLSGPFPVKIVEGQREAEVTVTCDAQTALEDPARVSARRGFAKRSRERRSGGAPHRLHRSRRRRG